MGGEQPPKLSGRSPEQGDRKGGKAPLGKQAPLGKHAPPAKTLVYLLGAAGAAALAWSGVIHIQLWSQGYESVPTVGPLFLAQGIGSIVVAAALVLFRRLVLMAAGALTLAATAGGLLLSVYVGLFGFRESLAVPYARESLVVEFTGAAALALAAVVTLAAARRGGGAGR